MEGGEEADARLPPRGLYQIAKNPAEILEAAAGDFPLRRPRGYGILS